MNEVRRSQERGHANHGWLDSHHSFSFADYYDPAHMGVGNLRVINEDRIAPGSGFGAHPHRDMEIVSYVLEGALAHKDSIGTGATIWPGEVQRMSAGTGIRHSEFNHSQTETTHFLQIWLLPQREGIAPGYEQKRYGEEQKRGRLCLVAAPDGRDGAVTVHSDAALYVGLFDAGEQAERCHVLPCEDGRIRRGSEVHRPPYGDLRVGGRRPRRPYGFGPGERGLPCGRDDRLPGMQSQPRSRRGLPR